jgi:hypothetical protein
VPDMARRRFHARRAPSLSSGTTAKHSAFRESLKIRCCFYNAIIELRIGVALARQAQGLDLRAGRTDDRLGARSNATGRCRRSGFGDLHSYCISIVSFGPRSIAARVVRLRCAAYARAAREKSCASTAWSRRRFSLPSPSGQKVTEPSNAANDASPECPPGARPSPLAPRAPPADDTQRATTSAPAGPDKTERRMVVDATAIAGDDDL